MNRKGVFIKEQAAKVLAWRSFRPVKQGRNKEVPSSIDGTKSFTRQSFPCA